jgi:hypothetical protein
VAAVPSRKSQWFLTQSVFTPSFRHRGHAVLAVMRLRIGAVFLPSVSRGFVGCHFAASSLWDSISCEMKGGIPMFFFRILVGPSGAPRPSGGGNRGRTHWVACLGRLNLSIPFGGQLISHTYVCGCGAPIRSRRRLTIQTDAAIQSIPFHCRPLMPSFFRRSGSRPIFDAHGGATAVVGILMVSLRGLQGLQGLFVAIFARDKSDFMGTCIV